jgi:hypothetical protein
MVFFRRAIAKDRRVLTTGVSNKVMEEVVFKRVGGKSPHLARKI